MANNTTVNKVVYGNSVLIDLTSDTITANDLKSGVTAHDASGQSITGSAVVGGGIDITITTEQSSLFGTTVTITKGQQTFTSTFSNVGVALFENLNIDGAIVVTDANGSTYNFTVKSSYSFSVGTLNYIAWLEAANIDPTGYSSLSDVLEDEVAIRKLMSLYAPVDYLATAKAGDPMMQTIINNDLCAKWITLRAYAEDTLSANAAIKAMMDSAGKYGYGEWALMPQVPVMTSNTSPYGEVIYNNQESGYEAFKVFDNDTSTIWSADTRDGANCYVGYKFINLICVKRIAVGILSSNYSHNTTFKIQASNDGTNWIDITGNLVNNVSITPQYYDVDNDVAYLYYRLYIVAQTHTTVYGTLVNTLQFYAYQPKGNVPVMTGASAPYGTVSESGHWSGHDPYKAFNNIIEKDQGWYPPSGSQANAYLRYQFTNPVNVKKIYLDYTSVGTTTAIKIQGSNDASSWTDIATQTLTQTSGADTQYINHIDISASSNTEYYLYYQLLITSGGSSSGQYAGLYVNELQFYGRELKVSVPKMTANDAPYGSVTQSSYTDNTRLGYIAFNGITTSITGWLPSQTDTTPHMTYNFLRSVLCKKVYCRFTTDRSAGSLSNVNIVFQGSNNGVDFVNVSDQITIIQGDSTRSDTKNDKWIELNPQISYKYYRIQAYGALHQGNSKAFLLTELYYFGNDYSEYDWDQDNPRHYLYDHGVEVDGALTLTTGASEEPQAIKLTAQNAQASKSLDTTSYNLLRGVEGMYGSGTNQLLCGSGSANFATDYLPYNQFLDISSINGSNATGIKQTAAGTFTCEEIWTE